MIDSICPKSVKPAIVNYFYLNCNYIGCFLLKENLHLFVFVSNIRDMSRKSGESVGLFYPECVKLETVQLFGLSFYNIVYP